MLLFKQLDTNQDGFLDEKELEKILPDSRKEEGDKPKKALSYRYKDDIHSGAAAADNLEELLKSKDKIFKTVMPKTDELDLPMFIKARREKYIAALLGKEVAVLQIKAQKRFQSQSKDKPQRKLVILESKSQFHQDALQQVVQTPASQHKRQHPMSTSV